LMGVRLENRRGARSL